MRQDRLALLRQRMITAERAAEFLEWLKELETEVKDKAWEDLSVKQGVQALHDLNSIACVIGLLKDMLSDRIEKGKDAEEEITKDGEWTGA